MLANLPPRFFIAIPITFFTLGVPCANAAPAGGLAGLRTALLLARLMPTVDCNTNNTDDALELPGHDCNTNAALDACELIDCNTNLTPDSCEVAIGSDCNADGLLDVCQLPPFMRRISVSATGATANNYAHDPVLSADGRFVAFYSPATNLVDVDTNGFEDVFVIDRITAVVTNIHHNNQGVAANGAAISTIDMTPDGRFVAFVSQATNLGGTGYQIYRFDRQANHLDLVSKTPSGLPGNSISAAPSMSGDGRYVAFESLASDLVPNDTNNKFDIFRYDFVANQMQRISVGMGGVNANGDSGANRFPVAPGNVYLGSHQVVLSVDGRFVAYASDASNLISNDTNGVRDVFVHDILTSVTSLVSASSSGQQGNLGSSGTALGWVYPAGLHMSSDGRFVVFDSAASNLAPGDANGRPDLFVHDRQTHQTSIIPLAGSSVAPLIAEPLISDDGRYVAFATNLTGLVAGQAAGGPNFFNVFRYDRVLNRLDLISRNAAGQGGNAGSPDPHAAMTPDGRLLAFVSDATNLTNDPPATATQLYLCTPAPIIGDCNTNGTSDPCELAGNDCNTNNTLDACDLNSFGSGAAGPTTPMSIPDLGSVASPFSPVQQVFVTDVNVQVNIRHTADAHLTLALARLNTTVTLASGLGGAGDNFANTVFDQQAATSITAVSPPFVGTFRPQGDLNVFNGLPKPGLWTLTVRDAAAGDTGTLLSWTLATAHRLTADCNTDGTPDACQLAASDCNTNRSLDICELPAVADCNTNSMPDACESDANANGTPDACECLTCLGDVNGDAAVDGRDVAGWVRCALGGAGAADHCPCMQGLTAAQFIDKVLQDADVACP